jgi:Fic family protein
MDYSYPSYAKISERSGLSTTFINDSIKRLEQAGVLIIDHSTCQGVCNRYYFNEIYRFERIPYELFKAEDLTGYEKATLLCLKQFFNQGLLETSYDLKQLAGYLGITKNTLSKQYSSLRCKGYISERSISAKGWNNDLIIRCFTNKIDWEYDYGMPEAVQPLSFELLMVA